MPRLAFHSAFWMEPPPTPGASGDARRDSTSLLQLSWAGLRMIAWLALTFFRG